MRLKCTKSQINKHVTNNLPLFSISFELRVYFTNTFYRRLIGLLKRSVFHGLTFINSTVVQTSDYLSQRHSIGFCASNLTNIRRVFFRIHSDLVFFCFFAFINVYILTVNSVKTNIISRSQSQNANNFCSLHFAVETVTRSRLHFNYLF